MEYPAIFVSKETWQDRSLTWTQKALVSLCLREISEHGNIDYEKCTNIMGLCRGKFNSMVSRLIRSGHIPDDRRGHIYLLWSDTLGLHKIGFSKMPVSRHIQIKREFPDCILTWFSRKTYVPLIEMALHERYFNNRKFGEWFKLTEDDVNIIKEDCP